MEHELLLCDLMKGCVPASRVAPPPLPESPGVADGRVLMFELESADTNLGSAGSAHRASEFVAMNPAYALHHKP